MYTNVRQGTLTLLICFVLLVSCSPLAGTQDATQPAAETEPVTLSPATPTPAEPLSPRAGVENPILEWTNEQDGQCSSLIVSVAEMLFGPCAGEMQVISAPLPERADLIAQFANKYASFEAGTPAGRLLFSGAGAVTATPWQQRAIAEWAQLVYDEATSGRGGAAWGLALTWNREGGFAGFCDSLTIYKSGEALVSSCKGNQTAGGQPIWLNSSQLRQLYTWTDTVHGFEFEQRDPAVADAMTVKILLVGSGTAEASESDYQAISELAQDLVAQARVVPDPAGMESSRKMVTAYLQALSQGDYNRAAELFGGDYQTLIDMNPERDPSDHLGLFESACTQNGFVCNLTVKNIVDEAQLWDGKFRLTVELQNPDGSLFQQGPCCGEDPALSPPITQFDYTVEYRDGKYLVMDLPIYVP